MTTEVGHPCKGRQKDLLGDFLRQLLIEQMAPTVTDDGILIVLHQDTQSPCMLPLGYIRPHSGLAPIQRLARGPRSLHVPPSLHVPLVRVPVVWGHGARRGIMQTPPHVHTEDAPSSPLRAPPLSHTVVT